MATTRPAAKRPAAKRSAASARNEILATLKDDHKRVKKALRDFGRLDPDRDGEQCRLIVEQACIELSLHATLEEELLYPAVKGALAKADLVAEAEVEHASAKALIEQLRGMTPEDEKYAATFKVLGEYVTHHIKEEEGEMFPQLSKLRFDWESLCGEMNARRAELAEQLLPQEADPRGADHDAAPTSTRGAAHSTRGAASKRSGPGGGESRARASGARDESPNGSGEPSDGADGNGNGNADGD